MLRQILLALCFACCSWGASLQWQASAVDAEHPQPDGYRVYIGFSPGVYIFSADVGANLGWVIPDDFFGDYFFAVAAYNSSGENFSDELYFRRDAPQTEPQYIGAVALRASKLQRGPIVADTALYTAAIAVYDFENNANDTKGSKNLTASGTPGYSTTGEAQGTYWAGELSGAYFYRSDADFRFSGDYSVSAWVRYTYVQEGYYTVIAQCYEAGSEGDGWTIDTDGSRHLRVRHSTGFTVTSSVFSGATLSNSTRYHIVVAYSDSGNTVTAWVSQTTFGDVINGTTVAMTANPGTSSAQRLNIGYSTIDADELWGYIDEAVFWSSAITSTNASAIFSARDGGTSWRETGGGSSAVPVHLIRRNPMAQLMGR